MIRSSTRRERLRAEMLTQIKGNARLLLTAGGAHAISLRAIAREIGITPAAIYRYYPNLKALIDALHDDILGELDTQIQFVRDQNPDDHPMVRLGKMARVFRRWALDHPAEFWLALGPASSGSEELVTAHGLPVIQFPRLIIFFLDEFVRSWQHCHAQMTPAGSPYKLTRVHVRAPSPVHHLDLPLPAVLGFASAWARLYGLVAIEISDQMKWPAAITDELFEAELAELGPSAG
jgi:AcrR family transcriptional regulator